MSVVGIDIGNCKCKVALARRGGIDVAVNDVSNRETPSLVSFNGHERFMGEKAVNQAHTNFKNTVTNIMRLIGKKYNSAEIQAEAAKSSVKLKPADDGGVLLELQYEDKPQCFRPERILSMLLSNLRETAEADLKSRIVDCVLAVPASFKVEERQGVMDAARLIGLNPLTLINCTTAAALQWGFYRTPEEGQVICIVDCGHSSMDVAIVQYGKDKLTVLGVASSTKATSAEMDYAIGQHLIAEFKEKFKVDAASRPRPLVRVLQAAEKAKRVLSANPQCPVNIECLMDDVDVRAHLTRDQVEELWKECLEDISPTIDRAVELSGVDRSKITTVEMIGGSSWIPAVMKAVTDSFAGATISRTLNASDSIAKGACLQCAMLSVTLKVRDYVVNDITPYGIASSWAHADGSGMKEVTVFEKKSVFPNRKMLTFNREQPFDVNIMYAEDRAEPLLQCNVSGMDAIKPLDADKEIKSTKIKVTLELTRSGTVVVEGAQVHEEYEVDVPVKEEKKEEKPVEEKKDDKAEEKKDDKADSEKKDAEMKDDTPAADAAAAEAEVPKTVKKTKVRKTPIAVTMTKTLGLSTADLAAESDAEWKLVAKDREIRDTQEARNTLETYVYDARSRLDGLRAYVLDADRTDFLAKLDGCEEWLYTDEGEEASKAVYTDKLAELQAIGGPIDKRSKEYEGLPDSYKVVEKALAENRTFLASTDSKYEHISAEEREKGTKQCDDVEATLATYKTDNGAKKTHENPAFPCAMVEGLAKPLTDAVWKIMNAPKPAPVKEEKKEEKKEEETPAADAAPAADDAPMADDAAATADPMDVDAQ